MKSEAHSDPTAESRKKDHIELAFKSQTPEEVIDDRFDYEPILAAHPQADYDLSIDFLNRKLSAPIWVSSMTGGTSLALTINKNLARACGEYGLGMGLGSCRSLLYSDDRLADFDMRPLMPNQPLYANLGVAQIEELIVSNDVAAMHRLVDKLRADGLIIHVNPMQEWLQPEGDRFVMTPLQVIHHCLEVCDYPLIVKEVGQGMGPASLETLLKLPLAAIDFAAHGGTNFALLELLRSDEKLMQSFDGLTKVGHSAEQMVRITNDLRSRLGEAVQCDQIIISGGIQSFLDGYYLTKIAECTAVYGQASAFLKEARGDYSSLQQHVERQISGLQIANSYLRIKA